APLNRVRRDTSVSGTRVSGTRAVVSSQQPITSLQFAGAFLTRGWRVVQGGWSGGTVSSRPCASEEKLHREGEQDGAHHAQCPLRRASGGEEGTHCEAMGRRGGRATRRVSSGKGDLTHLSYPTLRAGPRPLPPLARAERTA